MSQLDPQSYQRFSQPDLYEQYRPRYPVAVVDFLKRHLYLHRGSVVADIGCGTGISSALFVPHVRHVYGVEPNAAMLASATDNLRRYANFTPVQGSAEQTHLPDDSMNFVVAAQAWHWFDPARARLEFQRIIRRNSYVILLWNRRDTEHTPFMRDYQRFLHNFSTETLPEKIEAHKDQHLQHFYPDGYRTVAFPNYQTLRLDELKGLYLSYSYSLPPTHPRHHLALTALEALFEQHAQNGVIQMIYITELYFGLFNKHTPYIPTYKKIFYEALRPFALVFYLLIKANMKLWSLVYRLMGRRSR